MPDEAEAGQRQQLADALAACLTAGRCALCGAALRDEAAWHAGVVLCPACSSIHGRPPRCHAVWHPELVLLFQDSDSYELTD